MPTHNDSQKIYKKMSEENQPVPQTIIKRYLSIPLRTSKQRQLKQIIFFWSSHTIAHWKIQSCPGTFCFKVNWRWWFPLHNEAVKLRRGKIYKQLATVITISIQSHFLFHMGAAQICSALSHIRHTWEWKEETIVATVWNILSEAKSIRFS